MLLFCILHIKKSDFLIAALLRIRNNREQNNLNPHIV